MRKLLHKFGIHHWAYTWTEFRSPFTLVGAGSGYRICKICSKKQTGQTYNTFEGLETYWSNIK
jgi:hypothetical protein